MEHGAHGVVVSHPLRMRKALGSNPSVSIFAVRADLALAPGFAHLDGRTKQCRHDSILSDILGVQGAYLQLLILPGSAQNYSPGARESVRHVNEPIN